MDYFHNFNFHNFDHYMNASTGVHIAILIVMSLHDFAFQVINRDGKLMPLKLVFYCTEILHPKK